MTSSMTAIQGDISPASPNPNRGGSRRGRARRDQEGRPHEGVSDGSSRQGDRRRGGRGSHTRGRGRRAGEASQVHMYLDGTVDEPVPPVPPPPLKNEGTSGTRPTGDATEQQGEQGSQADEQLADDGAVEAEICFICASAVVHNAVAPCNHRTCHICALRLRALYKTKACAHCRTVSDYVIFTDDKIKRFEDFVEGDFATKDENLGVKYEKPDIFEDTVLLLRYNCPDSNCDVACFGWPDLHRHVRSVHHKVMCDLCTRNKKVFTHEHELFTQNSLRKHEKFGDDNPGAVDQSGFRGHPECGFCRQRFYGDDELYTHCRDKHERCHICDRRAEGRQPQYYIDYNSLETHFKTDHYLCAEQECLDKKFVVFESEMDLKAHWLEVHPSGLSKDARRDARRVDMSAFALRAPHEQERAGRRDGRGRARGRDPAIDPLPPSSAQPLRRDELAFQRQLAIHNAQSTAPRTFGGQLTPAQPSAASSRPAVEQPAAVGATRSAARNAENFPSLSTPSNGSTQASSASSQQAAALTPQEQARRLRHSAVTERAATLLKHDQQKLSDFRASISEYRNSSKSASELIESFFSLFETTSAELGKLIKELAEIFEISHKRDDLLKAWSDWKAVNEDYPSLPVGSDGTAGSATRAPGHGGSRVLKLKSSTAQSSRSAVSRQGSWGAVTGTTSFPALPPSRGGPGRSGGTAPWTASVASRPLPASSAGAASRAGGATAKASAPNNDAFPALPAAAKPSTTLFSPGYGGHAVRRPYDGRSGPSNVWSAAALSSGARPDGLDEDVDEGPGATGGKKKGKNKKQTLFHFG